MNAVGVPLIIFILRILWLFDYCCCLWCHFDTFFVGKPTRRCRNQYFTCTFGEFASQQYRELHDESRMVGADDLSHRTLDKFTRLSNNGNWKHKSESQERNWECQKVDNLMSKLDVNTSKLNILWLTHLRVARWTAHWFWSLAKAEIQ